MLSLRESSAGLSHRCPQCPPAPTALRWHSLAVTLPASLSPAPTVPPRVPSQAGSLRPRAWRRPWWAPAKVLGGPGCVPGLLSRVSGCRVACPGAQSRVRVLSTGEQLELVFSPPLDPHPESRAARVKLGRREGWVVERDFDAAFGVAWGIKSRRGKGGGRSAGRGRRGAGPGLAGSRTVAGCVRLKHAPFSSMCL